MYFNNVLSYPFSKDKPLKGCGGGSGVCRSFAAYGTATKAG